ncbi:MAG: hypothetical protein GY861_17610 [bacterium]|nr:hypothetical protein [bacterium]
MAVKSQKPGKGFIPIPKDMRVVSWKVIITDADGVQHDVTDYLFQGSLVRTATVGLSNCNISIDNNDGRYVGKFAAGDIVDFYYGYVAKASLTTVRCRCFVDGAYDNFDENGGIYLSIEGRDAPPSAAYEHFADTHPTLQFSGRNNLDCWVGTTGDQDAQGNYADGILYNSELIMKVYDTSSGTWKVYKDLTSEQQDTLKALTGYTSVVYQTFVEKSRLTMSQAIAKEGDYDFRIFYDSSDGKYYLMVHPEEAVTNDTEHITAGQNLMSMNRFGKDTLTEYNRVKEKGFKDGNILMMRTKEDTARQAALWIKDKEETTSSITSDTDLTAKAVARLAELKEALKKGAVNSMGLPTLHPGERIPVNIPFIIADRVKVKSFTVNFGTPSGLEFNVNLQDKETTFSKMFKDRIDENVNVTPSDNPDGMENGYAWDFSDSDDYELSNCQIIDNALSLEDGETSGTCTTDPIEADENVTQAVFRMKANNQWNCVFEVSNDAGANYTTVELDELITFSTTGKSLVVRVTLNEERAGVSPAFDKLNLLYK